ncbi:hypothetical protein C8R44DRAFT_850362 [Mycena epipterygia]|nr:hypothetical protein C8R44DRAFT_850362 [Mycena epipterygia]
MPRTQLAAIENCQNFTVSGGTFNVQATVDARDDDAEFHQIRLADLNLLREVDEQEIVQYQVVRRKRTGAVVRWVPVLAGSRRIHHARIHGSQEAFSAVVYEGSDFERARLIPINNFIQKHRQSMLATWYLTNEFESTGQLCLEVNDDGEEESKYAREAWVYPRTGHSFGLDLISPANLEDEVMAQMSLDDIHRLISYRHTERRSRRVEGTRVRAIFVTSLLRIALGNFVTLMGIGESS